jgi:hypothetical protein
VKHYFPDYNPPPYLITFVGPLEGVSEAITRNSLAVGLQNHLGSQFSYYTSEIGQQVLHNYRTRWFTRETIPVNCLKNVVADLWPEPRTGKPLVEQMVDVGKNLYVLDKVMPYTHDTLKLGYTKQQLEFCNRNEGQIWNVFASNNLLFTTENALLKGFMQPGPFTPELTEASPGAIGHYVGWQIVKKYMEKNSSVTPAQLLKTDAKTIFEESKYKPN